MAPLNHLTLSTGHIRRSPRSEVSDSILKALSPWLSDMARDGERRPIPAHGLEHYSATAAVAEDGMLCTVWGPVGPHTTGKFHSGQVTPIATIAVAQRDSDGAELWRMVHEQFGHLFRPGVSRPAAPWCAVVLHPDSAMFPDSAGWLGDFERCASWSWITRSPALRRAR